MNCHRIEPLLFDHLEGLLPEREAAAVAAHLDRCASCRLRWDTFLALRAELRGLSEVPTPPHLARRAVQRWAAEQAAAAQATDCSRLKSAFEGTAAWRFMARAPVAAALVFVALISLALIRLNRSTPISAPDLIAQGTDPSSPIREKNAFAQHRTNPGEPPKDVSSSRPGGGGSGQPRDTDGAPSKAIRNFDPWLPSPLHDQAPEPGLELARRGDDLKYLNGNDPVKNVRPWAPVARDEWDAIEAKVRSQVRVKDDFVQIAFPRIAGAAEGAIVAAVEQYKHEAAIVDPRLFHEVTLDQKATALSDLCDHLRSDTGIQLTAGPSVADEKVTVFCEKLPLREVMRQLSRPFGYTWVRSGKQGDYHYELVQDLRSQLEDESLRNRDRDQALLALEREIDRYRPYLSLSPDQALARAKTAPPGEKELLEKLAGEGWGPIHLYFQLSPQDQAALRSGQELKFSQEPEPGEQPLSPDLARAALESARRFRLARREGSLRRAGPSDADGMPLTAIPEARALVTLSLHQSELGRFNLEGGSGFRIAGGKMMSLTGNGPYGVGISPTVRQPENAAVNAALARDPALQGRVTVHPQSNLTPQPPSLQGKGETLGVASGHARAGLRPPSPSRGGAGGGARSEPRVTSADVLEALHRATGLPIVSDFYTRLYAPEVASAKDERLFNALNHLAGATRLRWHKDGHWLEFRSASYYDDRLKEVPNRLLARWAASCREHGTLTLDDLIEIAQLSNEQLDAVSMAEGAKEIWGLGGWGLARDAIPRRHLRFLAQCAPGQRQLAISSGGLSFTQMSLAQQQQFITLAFAYSMRPPEVRLEDLAGASLRVRYSLLGGFECRATAGPEELSVVWAPTRDAALQAARRLDPKVLPEQIVPSEEALTFLYTHGNPKTGLQAVAVRATPSDVNIW